jgi:methionyl aminopeptidase
MSIVSLAQLEALRRVGRIVRVALEAMRDRVRPGISTLELDRVAADVLAGHGAYAAPKRIYRFPGTACISVNDEIVHGVPGARVIAAGDVVKLDVTAGKDGFVADAAITVLVPPVEERNRRLVECAETAFERAIEVVRHGNRVCDIGLAVEDAVHAGGFSVVPELTGHGVGRTIHEQPVIPNYYDRRHRRRLTEGMVLAVEPIISAGSGRAVEGADGWTLRTRDGSVAAHVEHTVVVTGSRPILLTAARAGSSHAPRPALPGEIGYA